VSPAEGELDGDEYVAGDINLETTYEAGDINTTDGAPAYDDDDDDELDLEYEDGDINALGAASSAAAGAGAGEATATMPTAVLRYLAESLSNEPESVEITTEGRGGGVRLSLRVSPDDMGRVIGRRGRTAQALRTLVGVAGAREGIATSVDIVDD
jgi:predicted RNA-binding protein YlqC (UPF0109 family)